MVTLAGQGGVGLEVGFVHGSYMKNRALALADIAQEAIELVVPFGK
jgi:hypothetical protein